ncbi:hypothetical protein BKK52_09485 [Rodentibacter trehalosifermentans]|uniref:Uncharacterized protein n=1 Tax=Rodentibacter trehalosifermentans TaxID=1908263 RepID=A0A1V3IYG2_9PAST|nr:hypothetical protein [Rodentibacter trehalosifermentans]OOF47427.1 hypothetical protein BKK52_09485 [Rodentibacter trehalosifermentans]
MIVLRYPKIGVVNFFSVQQKVRWILKAFLQKLKFRYWQSNVEYCWQPKPDFGKQGDCFASQEGGVTFRKYYQAVIFKLNGK